MLTDAPGITMVAIHLSVNKPLPGVGAGDYAMDITSKTGLKSALPLFVVNVLFPEIGPH